MLYVRPMPDEPTRDERVESHLRALDEQLEQLRQLDAALDERARRSQAELRELKRRIATLSDGAQPDDPR